ncbi:MAG: hypothetical protein GQ540_03970 [Lutibacter sp.]|uniref:HNH endonuclease signature motif containing protein n=1 Tax=Lutibacter sp. TaxID=1925666 RepID=UPI0019EA90B7|nr:HNH endonuclease signature motif containing protein [Lutibacter sp.]NOR27671.1 hypothetical protein [Lutibacter sp.]
MFLKIVDTTVKPEYIEFGFGANKINIRPFSISEEMFDNCLRAINRFTNFNICNCWEWEGRNHNGYGSINVAGYKSTMWVHRVSYALFNGDILAENVIDHRCRNTLCLNPEHLIQVSHIDNCKAIHRRKRRDERAIIDTKQYNLWE